MTAAPSDRPILQARRNLVAGQSFEDLVAADFELLQDAGAPQAALNVATLLRK
jgi:hypothetical protein